jgi:hypothetical protein
VINLALMAAPVVALYWPTVVAFATNKLLPDNTSSTGPPKPVMKLTLMAAPVVALYSLTKALPKLPAPGWPT